MGAVTIPTVVGVMGEVKMLGAIAYTEKEFDTCIELIANKKINVLKYIDAKVSLDEAQNLLIDLLVEKMLLLKLYLNLI